MLHNFRVSHHAVVGNVILDKNVVLDGATVGVDKATYEAYLEEQP